MKQIFCKNINHSFVVILNITKSQDLKLFQAIGSLSEILLTLFYLMFPFEPPENIRKHNIFTWLGSKKC